MVLENVLRYIIVLASLALFAAITPTSDVFEKKINVDENKTYVGSLTLQNAAVNRHRRYIRKGVINLLATAVETFHVKPILAAGIDNANNFGKTMDNVFHETPKVVNVMLNEDPKLGDKSSTNGVKNEVKSITNKEELTTAKIEIHYLKALHKIAEGIEKDLIDNIVEETKGKIQIDGLKDLHAKGTNHARSEITLKKLIAVKADLKTRVVTDIARIRQIRQLIKKNENEFSKKSLFHIFSKNELDDINLIMKHIRSVNNKWLLHKNDPELVNTPATNK